MANHREMLNEVFYNVLENLAFMFGESVENDSLDEMAHDAVEARMRFAGPFSGSLSLVMPRNMCQELAANVLGLDPEDEQADASGEDALKELLNVTCGQVLTSLAGQEPVFDLSVPLVEPLDESRWQTLVADEDTAAFLIDEQPVLLHLALDS